METLKYCHTKHYFRQPILKYQFEEYIKYNNDKSFYNIVQKVLLSHNAIYLFILFLFFFISSDANPTLFNDAELVNKNSKKGNTILRCK